MATYVTGERTFFWVFCFFKIQVGLVWESLWEEESPLSLLYPLGWDMWHSHVMSHLRSLGPFARSASPLITKTIPRSVCAFRCHYFDHFVYFCLKFQEQLWNPLKHLASFNFCKIIQFFENSDRISIILHA